MTKPEHNKIYCNQCEYKATQKSKLVTHIKSIHLGVKYPCAQCDYKATQKRSLLKHIKSKHSILVINVTIKQHRRLGF